MSAPMPDTVPPARRPRVAVVLLNLGGPDSPAAIRPFLVNLFTDPAILRVPSFLRGALGRFIAWRRLKPATENYAILGGRSPLLELTQEQGAALEAALAPEMDVRCVVAMRYWHPFAAEAVRAVRDFAPDEVLLLPLYPQFSTTTTGSSLDDWHAACAAQGYEGDPNIRRAIDFLTGPEMLAAGRAENLQRLHDELVNKDWFQTLPDFNAYVVRKGQALADYAYDPLGWRRKCLVNIAKAGMFSSDRTIAEYDKDIWHLG